MYKMILMRSLLIFALSGVALASCTAAPDKVVVESAVFSRPWLSGLVPNEPPLQVQQYDQDTVVIRQSLSSSFEAPFMYLIFGEEKALLIDTGAGGIDLRSLVDGLIDERLEELGRDRISLVVMHTHGHGDHVAADEQFAGRDDTVIVGHGADAVADFFSIENWPVDTSAFDLGGRIVDIIPTPGHHDSHVMVYDRSTQLLFSGDVLYPGRLYFQCAKADDFKRSISRVAEFSNTRDIRWILGAHIELTTDSGEAFGSSDRVRANERLLEMTPAIITDVQSALLQAGERLRVESYDDFILFPHPADPRGKQPPDWCLDNSDYPLIGQL